MAFNICYQKYHEHWCKPCHSKHFRNNFNNWTSGNDKIDKFIQDARLNANKNREVIEWIPYDRFENVKQIGRGGFGTKHYARWIDEPIKEWDIENQQWKRDCQEEVEVVLKKFDNFVNLNKDFLNETIFQLNFMELHKIQNKLIGANPNNPEKKNIFGVLPYIAPEVLSGEKEYTKAADVYSFGIIAYEIVTGFPPYPDIPHDKDLAMKICSGLRPTIPFHTPKLITRMIMRCWDARVTHRPTFEELYTIYTSRLLNYSSLPEPKNEENFERELEELTKSMFPINKYQRDKKGKLIVEYDARLRTDWCLKQKNLYELQINRDLNGSWGIFFWVLLDGALKDAEIVKILNAADELELIKFIQKYLIMNKIKILHQNSTIICPITHQGLKNLAKTD
ncbi:hypothetical protein Glove_23g152 [Diversispora epigaea]|uniref:Protein kinase domain-containing protein n=1 Tax=Diversispora epigaea TaxID=1348612 RepID=A0A397JIX2_9GLOM|nr:hypothetical protein Glove_23g152 [Diversispora epigaea]